MSLYTRRRQSLGSQRASAETGKGLAGILISSPLSFHYQAPVKDQNTKTLHQYFVYIQTRRYGQVLDLPQMAVRKHFKILLGKHSASWLCRAVKYASWISEYPFSVYFAEKVLMDYESQFGEFESGYDSPARESASLVPALRVESTAQLELFVAQRR